MEVSLGSDSRTWLRVVNKLLYYIPGTVIYIINIPCPRFGPISRFLAQSLTISRHMLSTLNEPQPSRTVASRNVSILH